MKAVHSRDNQANLPVQAHQEKDQHQAQGIRAGQRQAPAASKRQMGPPWKKLSCRMPISYTGTAVGLAIDIRDTIPYQNEVCPVYHNRVTLAAWAGRDLEDITASAI